jgi:hypothetical protein
LPARFGAVFVPATAAALIYWALAAFMRVPSATEIWKLTLGRVLRRK